MGFAEVADKARSCAASAGWPAAATERIIAAVRDLENAVDIRALTALVARP
jgi:hypothetical protein